MLPFWVIIPAVVPWLGLGAAKTSTIIDGSFVAIEVVWLCSIPLLGLQGFKELKQQTFATIKKYLTKSLEVITMNNKTNKPTELKAADATNTLTDIPMEQRVGKMIMGYWHGIPTLFGREFNPNPADCDIGLIGIPHSAGNGVTERDQHFGPRALRNVSGTYQRPHKYFDNMVPWEACRINDLGDVEMPYAMNNDQSIADITEQMKKIVAAGTFPVSIGGDHSITLPCLRAVAGPESPLTDEPIAVIHFDSHSDAFESGKGGTMLGNQFWAGNWGVNMNLEGLVSPENVVTVGLRGHGSSAEYHDKVGYNVIYQDEVEEIGIPATIQKIRDIVGDKPVYITFDLDVLSCHEAPGVSNLEPGFDGFSIGEATKTLRGFRHLNVIGGDIVCPMPTKDSENRITSLHTAVIMYEIMSLIADRIKK